jgi:hypothetical protein
VKLTIFHSSKGDCLLLTSADKKSILCDGGMQGSFKDAVAPVLSKSLPKGGRLDVVYVSHIDEDHVGGVIQLLDDTLDWKVFQLHQDHGDTGFKPPKSPKPPAIGEIWHNSFHGLVRDNAGPISDLLAASALGLRLIDQDWARNVGAWSAKIANSIPQAMRVSRRISKQQLDIPLNRPAAGKLMMSGAAGAGSIPVGSMRVTVIGPQRKDLDGLRKAWNEFLESAEGVVAVKKVDADARKDEARLVASFPKLDAARFLAAAKKLGERKDVTLPNLASLLLFVEENGRTMLLTGDGHSGDVENGLEGAGIVGPNQGLHVNVLKVPHHGAKANTTQEFTRRVTADHYVFCGDGFEDNPEIEVLEAYLNSRLSSKPSKLSPNPQARKPFRFWFSCDSASTTPSREPHMKKVEALVKKAANKSAGRLRVRFRAGKPLSFTI